MIIRNIVTDEAEIKKFLKTLCQNKPLLCKKQSVSGFSSNQRVIVVRAQDFEFYNPPSKFKDNQLATLQQKYMKAKVSLQYIYELSFLPQNSAQKKSMLLTIPINKISAKNIELYKQSVLKSASSKQNQQNFVISWLFTFDYDVKAKIFKQLQDEQKKKNQILNNVVKYDPQSDLADSILNMSKQKINQFNQKDPVKDLYTNIQKLKQIKQQIEFQQRIEKQQQQRQRAIKLSMSLRKNQKGQNGQQNIDQQEIYPIKMVWRQYWKAYQKVSRFIGQPLSKQYIQKQLQLLNEVYKIETQVRSIATQFINFKMIGWSPDKIVFQDYQMYKGIWIKLGGKQLNQQFLSNYYLSDLMYFIKSHKKLKFRIPPMFFINYKTVKALCMIDQPFSSIKALQKQIYNIKAEKSQMDFQLMNRIKEGLQLFQRIMNIKCQNYIHGNTQTTAPLGQIKVFQYDNKFQQNSSHYLQNFYYVVGVKGLFPVDYQFQIQKRQPQYCLRPEIIAQYRDYMQSMYREDNQLLTQAFMNSQINIQVKGKQDAKVVQVSKQFIPLKIKRLMYEFNQINLILIDSYSIKNYMSDMGINARYLGYMYKLTQIPYIQQTLQIQMLSKTIKTIYVQSIKDIISNQTLMKRQLYLKKHKEALKQNIKTHHQLMANNAIDFLNLVFGVGRQTDQFWKIVIKKCHNKFGYQFKYPVKVKLGCLLHAVLWHCGLIINFDLDIKLFQTQKPFDMKNWHDFRIQIKSFQYPSFQINKIVKKLSNIDYLKQADQISKYAFSFLKLELLRNNNSFGLGLKTQITLARINNMKSQLQKPLRQCSYHPSQLPYYFSNLSQQNFKKALDIINFSLASNHPLFISLYDTYSEQFQPQLLKKSALLAAIKGLGQFHPRTTQLYSKYYRQGLEEFQIKAKRSSQTQAALTISQQLFSKRKFQSCLHFCFSRIQKRQAQKSNANGQDLSMYIQILKYGIISAVKTRFYQKGFIIAQQFSQMINTYKIRSHQEHQLLLYHALIIRLNLTSQKFYIYKMVLLVVHIQKQFEKNLSMDSQNFLLPRSADQKSKILLGIMNQYYAQQTHSKWIQHIFHSLRRGYLYFNYLNDLFNNYQYHLKNYGMAEFSNALGYLDVLVRYFGQKIFHEHLYNINN